MKLNLNIRKILVLALLAATTQAQATHVYNADTFRHTFSEGDAYEWTTWNLNDKVTFASTSGGKVVTVNVPDHNGFISLYNAQNFVVNSNGASMVAKTVFNIVFKDNEKVTIKGDFFMDTGSHTTPTTQWDRNFAMSGNNLTMTITAGKTFTLNSDITGDQGSTLILAGGGTLDYLYIDTEMAPGTQHDGVSMSISAGSTFDISRNDASQIDNLIFRENTSGVGGDFTMTDGHIKLMTGDITLANDFILTGANSIQGATNLTLTGDIAITYTDTTLISFGDSNVDLSGANISLSGMGTNISYDLFQSFGGLSIDHDNPYMEFAGYEGRDQSWRYDSNTGIYSVLFHKTLTWEAGDGTISLNTGGFAEAGEVFLSNDAVIIQGASGTINIQEAGLSMSSLTINGDNDYTIDGGAITMLGDELQVNNFVKNGTGTLYLKSDNNLTDITKHVNAGTLSVGSTNALGTGKVLIASGATLQIEDGLTIDTGVTEGYTRSTSGYDVLLGNNSILRENVTLEISGNETVTIGTMDGATGGLYEITGLALSKENSAGHLVIGAGATLKTTGTVLSAGTDSSLTGSFTIAGENQNNTVTVNGVLDIQSGISNRGGNGTITVNDGGELILRSGLAAVIKQGSASDTNRIVINIGNGGTLSMFNKDNSGLSGTENLEYAPTVNMQTGSTLQAAETGVTTVDSAITFAEAADVTMAVAKNNTLILEQTVTTGSITMEGDGTFTANSIVLQGGTITRAASQEVSITSKGGTSVSVKNRVDSVNAILTATSITHAELVDVSINTTGNRATISDSFISNSSLSNVILSDNVVLDGPVDLEDITLATANLVVTEQAERIPTIELQGDVTGNDVLLYTVDNIETILYSNLVDGNLTLDLGTLDAFAADYDAKKNIAFQLTDVVHLNEILDGGSASNISLIINGTTYQAQGSVMYDGFVTIYIPEPSTASLSLLALAGLLARRRRKKLTI